MIIREQVPLAPLTTLGVGGPARYFAEARTEAEVRESVEFVDCDNLKATIYFFGAYLDLGKVPFIDAPDFSYLPPGENIIETYRRVPSNCLVCDSVGTPAVSAWKKR